MTHNNPNLLPRSCQYQCICKIWSHSINSCSRYWAGTKFRQKSWIKKGHNSVTIWWKLTTKHPNLDLVDINAYAKFGKTPPNRSQDIEQKWSRNDRQKVITEWWNHGQPENSKHHRAPYFVCGVYKNVQSESKSSIKSDHRQKKKKKTKNKKKKKKKKKQKHKQRQWRFRRLDISTIRHFV